MSIVNLNGVEEQSTSGVDGRFVQYQLLISRLLKMKTTPEDKKELLCQCRKSYKDNPCQLKYVKELEGEYVGEHALWWYSRESFLYRMLNEALRIQNIDLLFLLRFFIRDIRKQLRQRQYLSPYSSLSSSSHFQGRIKSLDKFRQ